MPKRIEITLRRFPTTYEKLKKLAEKNGVKFDQLLDEIFSDYATKFPARAVAKEPDAKDVQDVGMYIVSSIKAWKKTAKKKK